MILNDSFLQHVPYHFGTWNISWALLLNFSACIFFSLKYISILECTLSKSWFFLLPPTHTVMKILHHFIKNSRYHSSTCYWHLLKPLPSIKFYIIQECSHIHKFHCPALQSALVNRASESCPIHNLLVSATTCWLSCSSFRIYFPFSLRIPSTSLPKLCSDLTLDLW